jgi:hypothetical protein
MDYFKGVLCALAAILIAESVFWWPLVKGSKATGVYLVPILLGESFLSPRFWIAGLLSFGIFFVASRASTVLRVLFFWIPTVTVSVVGLLVVGMYTWLYFYAIANPPQVH